MINYKKKYRIYFWCCDLHSNTGEGKLAILFLEYLLKFKKKEVIKVSTLNKNFFIKNKISNEILRVTKTINFNFFINYILPFFGILMLWVNYLKNKKLFYVNYLPLWNIFIFLLSPPKTNFGPITGSLYFGRVYNLNTFIRKYIFIILYKVSYILLLIRKKKIIFSTNNLYFLCKKKEYKKKNFFNFQTLYLYNKKIIKKKKNIDFLIYYRKHIRKNYNYLKKILNQKKFEKINCIGNDFLFNNVNNLGVINHLETQKLLSKSKYTFITSENFQSFYCLDSILNSVGIIFEKNYRNFDKKFFLNSIKFTKVPLFRNNIKKNFYYKVNFINEKNLKILNNNALTFLKSYYY